jgi:DNA-binding beta-propeller fold protein YncE
VAPKVQRIALSVDDKLVFTADQTKPQLAVIDTATNKLKTWIPLPAQGYGAAPTPDGRWLVVALPSGKQVAVVDLSTMKVAHTIDVPPAPQEVLISPDGHTAYVSCDASQKVAAIRTSDWTVEKLINAGRGVDGLNSFVRKDSGRSSISRRSHLLPRCPAHPSRALPALSSPRRNRPHAAGHVRRRETMGAPDGQ